MNSDSEVNVFIDVKREFYIDKIGYLYDHNLDSNFEFSGECHNFTEIAYLESGVIEIVSGENVYILRDGDIIFHMPMAFHKLKNKGNCVAKLRNLSFIHFGAVPSEIYSGVYSLDNSQKSEFNMIFDVAFENYGSRESGNRLTCEASERLTAFILGLCRSGKKQNSFSQDSGAIIFKKLVEKMSQSIYDNPNISELAAECNVSVSYVKLLFKKYADVSPKNYFLHLKAQEAARSLRCGEQVSDVSDIMGFSSPNYFSYFFKKAFGVTPKDYRNSFLK